MEIVTRSDAPPTAASVPRLLRSAAIALGGLAVLAALMVWSLTLGSRITPWLDSIAAIPDAVDYALFPKDSSLVGNPDERAQLAVLIGGLRLPRTLIALLAGGALGLAGAIIQGHTRNPLAEPGVLGINTGAAATLIGATYLGLTPTYAVSTTAAVLGAAVVTTVVFVLAGAGKGGMDPMTIILAGVALTALLMAFVSAMVLTSTRALDTFRNWATGSVEGTSMTTVWAVLPFAVMGCALALPQGKALNLLDLGGASAHALGLSVRRARILGIASVALLGGAAVAGAGPITFVGLAAPHIVRRWTGPDYRLILPYSAVVGAGLTLGADMIGRVIIQPAELQMGIVLALVGAPLFIGLVRGGKVGG